MTEASTTVSITSPDCRPRARDGLSFKEASGGVRIAPTRPRRPHAKTPAGGDRRLRLSLALGFSVSPSLCLSVSLSLCRCLSVSLSLCLSLSLSLAPSFPLKTPVRAYINHCRACVVRVFSSSPATTAGCALLLVAAASSGSSQCTRRAALLIAQQERRTTYLARITPSLRCCRLTQSTAPLISHVRPQQRRRRNRQMQSLGRHE